MQQGWVKLYRQLIVKPIWTTSTHEQRTILITLLCLAEHKQTTSYWKGKPFELNPGQFITTIVELVHLTTTTPKIVRNALVKFKKLGMIDYEGANKNTLVTIVNWGFYQDGMPHEGKQKANERQSIDILETNERQSIDKLETFKGRTKELRNPGIPLPERDSEPLRSKEIKNLEDDETTAELVNIYSEVDPELIRHIAKLAIAYGAQDQRRYMVKIINDCIAAGTVTKENFLSSVNDENKTRNRVRPPQSKAKTRNRRNGFCNFAERDDIDFEEMRRLEMELIDKTLAEG